MSWHRHYGLPRKQELMRPDLARQQFWSSFWAGAQIVFGLLLLLAVYGWMGAADAAAAAEDAQHKAERVVAHCLNGGTFSVNDRDAIKCGTPLYEKGN